MKFKNSRRAAILTCALSLSAGHFAPTSATPTAPSTQLVTCIDLQNGKERISKNGTCRTTREAIAKWHLVQSDSLLASSTNLKTLTICSNRESASVVYQMIRNKCARHQSSTLYLRSSALAVMPVIAHAVSIGHDKSEIVLAQDPAINPDAPIAYYTVTSNMGDSQKIYSWRDRRLVISGLQALTSYSFTVTATTADGTSPVSVPTISIMTLAYVSPAPAPVPVPAATVAPTETPAPTAQVSFISSETASAMIPAGVTNVVISSNTLGNPRLTFASQGSTLSATIQIITNPAPEGSTPFTVSGSTKIVDISVSGITGSTTICLDASPNAKLWHYVGGAWVDITSSHTGSQVCGITSSFSPFVGEIQLAAPAFALSSASETATVGTAITGYTISESPSGGAIASYSISPAAPAGLTFDTSTGLLSGTPTSVASATVYTITATNVTGSASRTFTLSVDTGVYTVGQRGPGGGIVYYVSDQPFTSPGSACNTQCKYLEVAPSTWQSGGVSTELDRSYAWSNNRNLRSVQDVSTPSNEGFISAVADEKFNWRIGQGFYNTSVMKVAGAVSAAQAAVLNYAGGGFTGQWFIPSLHELNELCKYARGQTTGDPTVACVEGGLTKGGLEDDLGGFVGSAGGYWSSSEYSPVTSPAAVALTQHVQGSSHLSQTQKNLARSIRPIRAF
jgi:hypothetical protein